MSSRCRRRRFLSLILVALLSICAHEVSLHPPLGPKICEGFVSTGAGSDPARRWRHPGVSRKRRWMIDSFPVVRGAAEADRNVIGGSEFNVLLVET